MPKHLSITKRVSLAGFAEDWTDEAYLRVRLMTNAENKELVEFNQSAHTDEEAEAYGLAVIKKHTIDGKVFAIDDDGSVVLDDFDADTHFEDSADLRNKAFFAINGIDADPKDFLAQTVSQQVKDSTKTQETTSSPTPTQ